jgi:hypothetical protein
MMGVQQHTDKTRQQVEGSILDPRRAFQAHGHVFWAYQFTSNFSDDDEHHIPMGSSRRMVLHLYGQWHHLHKTETGKNRGKAPNKT